MLYIEYEHLKNRYKCTQKQFDDILTEKEELFQKTQLRSIEYDKEKVDGGIVNNTFDTYLIEKEKKQIDERIQEAKILLTERQLQLWHKEVELRESKELSDKIYVLKYLNNKKNWEIADIVGYSKPQIYRLLEKIEKNIKMRKNEKNNVL